MRVVEFYSSIIVNWKSNSHEFRYLEMRCVWPSQLIWLRILLFQTLNFFYGIVTDQQSEMFLPLCEKPPSIIQWLYNFLNGHPVRERWHRNVVEWIFRSYGQDNWKWNWRSSASNTRLNLFLCYQELPSTRIISLWWGWFISSLMDEWSS